MSSASRAVAYVISLFVLVALQNVVINPLISLAEAGPSAEPGALSSAEVGGGNETAGAFNETAVFDVPLLGEVDFSDPLTLGTILLTGLVALALAAAAAGFVTGGTAGPAFGAVGFLGIFLGIMVVGLVILFPLFDLFGAPGIAAFGVYATAGILVASDAALGMLAGR